MKRYNVEQFTLGVLWVKNWLEQFSNYKVKRQDLPPEELQQIEKEPLGMFLLDLIEQKGYLAVYHLERVLGNTKNYLNLYDLCYRDFSEYYQLPEGIEKEKIFVNPHRTLFKKYNIVGVLLNDLSNFKWNIHTIIDDDYLFAGDTEYIVIFSSKKEGK